MNNKNLFMEVHVIQSIPFSNINRDDVGMPKTGIYGGTIRARASSQSYKKNIRERFKKYFPENELGVRTRELTDMFKNKLIEILQDHDVKTAGDINDKNIDDAVAAILERSEIEKKDKETKDKETKNKETKNKEKKDKEKKDKETKDKETKKVMIFLSNKEVEELCRTTLLLGLDEKNAKEKANELFGTSDLKNIYKNILKNNLSMDIIMFGRMVASNPDMNVDACVQVAHTMSTHAVQSDTDYFTAVDDLCTNGAGHIDNADFNSATVYRYASVDVKSIFDEFENVSMAPEDKKEYIAKSVSLFLKEFVFAMPNGKMNSFANHTMPEFVYVTFRTDEQVNMAPAFEKAISPSPEGYVDRSVEALKDYALSVYRDFVSAPTDALCIGRDEPDLGDRVSLLNAINTVHDKVKDYD